MLAGKKVDGCGPSGKEDEADRRGLSDTGKKADGCGPSGCGIGDDKEEGYGLASTGKLPSGNQRDGS
jgi:hypothetical protein